MIFWNVNQFLTIAHAVVLKVVNLTTEPLRNAANHDTRVFKMNLWNISKQKKKKKTKQ